MCLFMGRDWYQILMNESIGIDTPGISISIGGINMSRILLPTTTWPSLCLSQREGMAICFSPQL